MGRTRVKVPTEAGNVLRDKSRGDSVSRKGAGKRSSTPGRRTGTKRRDNRWTAPNGTVWASRFEFEVYLALKTQGYEVRKTGPQDSMDYTSAVRSGRCLQCDSCRVVTEHKFTPDLLVGAEPGSKRAENEPAGYYIEVKGYIRAPRRALLRSFRKARPDVDIRLVAQRDYKVGATTLTGWAAKFLKAPVHVWNGGLPDEWRR